MNGVAITTSSEVEKFAHTSSGMRQKLMPGARMVMIVTRKFSAVATEEAPANWTRDREEELAHRRVGGERRVGRPAGGEGAAGGEEARHHHDARRSAAASRTARSGAGTPCPARRS